MSTSVSKRLKDIAEALPLKPGIRVLEIGCGPGVLARAILERVPTAFVLGIDRSAKAIEQARKGSAALIEQGRLSFRQASIESFRPTEYFDPFDLAVAIRVGVLDGRHPEAEEEAVRSIRLLLKKAGKLYIDGGTAIQLYKL
ncbi:MAG: class I SAM-dependent methyltransferase [Chitinophagaceae bacterium]